MKTESTIKHIQRLTDRLNSEIQDKAAELTNKEFAAVSISTFAHYLGVIFRYQCGVAKYKRPLRTA